MTKKKQLASMKSPLIAAAVESRYRFASKEDAITKIKSLEERFVRSRHSPEAQDDRAIIWVEGYQVTEEEAEKGYKGNYAIIYAKPTEDGKYTLATFKLDSDCKYHPKRLRPRQKHPDWGYYLLRKIKKGTHYDSVEAAYDDLMKIAEDFPEVSIPAQNKLYTIIYQKKPDDSMPLEKIILEIEVVREGGFTIVCKENTYQKNEDPLKPKPKAEQKGYHASQMELKRHKKIVPPRPTEEMETE